MSDLFHCGPVTLRLTAQMPELLALTSAELSLYTHDLADSVWPIDVHVHEGTGETAMVGGNFLRCRSMHVERTVTGLSATCRSGAAGTYDVELKRWDLYLPAQRIGEGAEQVEDINLEDLLELVLTTAWRQAGWIPLHAGAVVRDGRCAILTAPSRGGKTTLTAALLHLGWQTLGDDKLLVRLQADGCVEIRSLQSHFNIDPRTKQWFAEVGDLSHLPLDSAWTPKRRVEIESIWPGRLLQKALPTHLIQIRRYPDHRPTQVQALGHPQVLSALLHQTVIPADPTTARNILAVIAPAAGRLQGVQLEMGEDAYSDPHTLALLERILG